jgi:hypothetical protein
MAALREFGSSNFSTFIFLLPFVHPSPFFAGYFDRSRRLKMGKGKGINLERKEGMGYGHCSGGWGEGRRLTVLRLAGLTPPPPSAAAGGRELGEGVNDLEKEEEEGFQLLTTAECRRNTTQKGIGRTVPLPSGCNRLGMSSFSSPFPFLSFR